MRSRGLHGLWSGCSWLGGGGWPGHLSQFGLRDLFALFVDAHCDLHKFTAILVPHIDAVFSRIFHVNTLDCEAGKLAALEGDLVAVVRQNLLLILEPGDLWAGVTPHCASETQALQR